MRRRGVTSAKEIMTTAKALSVKPSPAGAAFLRASGSGSVGLARDRGGDRPRVDFSLLVRLHSAVRQA